MLRQLICTTEKNKLWETSPLTQVSVILYGLKTYKTSTGGGTALWRTSGLPVHLEIQFSSNWKNTMQRFFRSVFQRQALKSLLNIHLHKLIVINTVAAIILFIIFMDSQSADTKKYFQPHIQSYYFVTDKC